MTDKNTNFRGKVVYYTNVNGKEQRIEKEFDNPAEYQNFINNNNLQLPTTWANIWTSGLNNFFDDFFTHKLENFLGRSALNYHNINNTETTTIWYDEYNNHLAEYEKDLKKLEEEKTRKEERKSYLTWLIEKLKEYKKRFEEAWLKEKIKNIEEDIKKATKELKELV